MASSTYKTKSGETVTREIIKYNTDSGEVQLSRSIIRKYLVSGKGEVTDDEVMMFLTLCRYQKLNPFLREAYLIKYSNDSPAATVVGKEVFTQRAAKNEQFNGFTAGVWVRTEEGELEPRTGSMVLPGETIAGGWAKVFRKDWDNPVEASVSFEEYAGYKDREKGILNRMWGAKSATMIRKVALVQALREAFPRTFAGLLDSSEVDTGDTPLPETAVKVEATIVDEADTGDVTPEAEEGWEEMGGENDPDHIPREEPKDTLQQDTKQCRDAVTLLKKRNFIDGEGASKATSRITELAANKDIPGLRALHNDLKELYMEKIGKELDGGSQ